MNYPNLLFLDTECLGTDPAAPTWEIAAVRVWPNGHERGIEVLVEHDPGDWPLTLPKAFCNDYDDRYHADDAYPARQAIKYLADLIGDGKPIVVGSHPSFDMTRLEKLSADIDGEPLAWHYHPLDMPTLAHGWLLGKGVAPAPPWKSDLLSQMIGVSPTDFDRHTAMGDVKWCMAMWNAVTA